MNKAYSIPLFILTGLVAAMTSLIISLLFFNQHSAENSLGSIIALATIEELVKLTFLVFTFKAFEVRGTIIGIFYGMLLGSGFALFETLLIFLSKNALGFPILLIFLVHILTSSILAPGALVIKDKTNLWKTFVLFFLAIVFHLCYNIFVFKN